MLAQALDAPQHRDRRSRGRDAAARRLRGRDRAASTSSALLLFLLVFVWTPPHFWALALLLRRQYEQAGIPMLPVVAGERETTRQIVAYTRPARRP